MSISSEIERLNKELPSTVKLVAVSKFNPSEAIMEAYQAGQRIFGESRPQELLQKVQELPQDIQWHFIGHLQTNKLKMVLPYVSLIQSVDSLRLLAAINTWGQANGKILNVLLEPHVASEETKQGFSPEEIVDIISEAERFESICFKGLMGMATYTEDESVIRSDFARIADLRSEILNAFPTLADDFTELSIGMSDDYPIAIEYGSTMVRIGSMIFGSRV
jgi:pyridoxal phosphate enzyme (YggS family)